MFKILVAGLILILSTACLPHRDALSDRTKPAEARECPPLSPSSPSPSPSLDLSPSPSPSVTKNQNGSAGEEPNDDFSLEVLPKDRNKKSQEFDIPIEINARVEQFIQYFQTSGRKVFTSWLSRSERYIPIMRSLLKENGLPEDLVYMALIESGFNPYAYSRSKAAGPWQFIYLTGKRYGLNSNWWIDERRDPEKSTVAAAKYLKDLYDTFECWYLAAASYNAGEGKIARGMKRYQTEDFWELAKYRYLKQETKDYVPQMIAAALIAKDPDQYGFTGIEYQEPLRYEKVCVPEVTDLRLVAQACEVTFDEIKDLNPELSRWCTPPHLSDYELKIPYGKKALFLKNFESLNTGIKFQFKTHQVKKGETLSKIAKQYRVDLSPILELNRLNKKSHLSKGMELLIPLPKEEDSKPDRIAGEISGEKDRRQTSNEIIYTIKKGDSLWSIANETGVNIGALSRWNKLNPGKKLMPGDKLKIRITKK